jgi:hypothetical protein
MYSQLMYILYIHRQLSSRRQTNLDDEIDGLHALQDRFGLEHCHRPPITGHALCRLRLQRAVARRLRRAAPASKR